MLTEWLTGFTEFYIATGWITLVWVYLLLFMHVTFHELGHALMAMLLGTRVTRFQTGTLVLGQFRIGGTVVQLGLIPAGGAVSYEYTDDALRWKVVAATLAGPLLPVMISFPLFLTPLSPFITYFIGLIVIVGTLVDLWPWKHGSDGQKIVMHLRHIYRGHITLNMGSEV